MRIIPFITQGSVIDQILTHLRARPAPPAHAGPRRRAEPPIDAGPQEPGYVTRRPPTASAICHLPEMMLLGAS